MPNKLRTSNLIISLWGMSIAEGESLAGGVFTTGGMSGLVRVSMVGDDRSVDGVLSVSSVSTAGSIVPNGGASLGDRVSSGGCVCAEREEGSVGEVFIVFYSIRL